MGVSFTILIFIFIPLTLILIGIISLMTKPINVYGVMSLVLYFILACLVIYLLVYARYDILFVTYLFGAYMLLILASRGNKAGTTDDNR